MGAVAHFASRRRFSRSADFGIGRGRELSADRGNAADDGTHDLPLEATWFEQDGIDGLAPPQHGWEGQPAARGRCGSAGSHRAPRHNKSQPADGSTHWSCRKMAAALHELSKSTVQRVWAQMRLKPHRLDGYMVIQRSTL